MLSNDLDAILWRARFDELHPVLYRFLLRMTGYDEDMAKDYLSEVFIILVEKDRSKRVEINKQFAYAVASNVLMHHRRSFVSHRRIEEKGFIPTALLDGEARSAVNPESIHQREEMAKTVRKVLSALPEGVRLGWVLHRVDGMTIEDTAQAIRRSLTTTKEYVHRGDAALEGLRTSSVGGAKGGATSVGGASSVGNGERALGGAAGGRGTSDAGAIDGGSTPAMCEPTPPATGIFAAPNGSGNACTIAPPCSAGTALGKASSSTNGDAGTTYLPTEQRDAAIQEPSS